MNNGETGADVGRRGAGLRWGADYYGESSVTYIERTRAGGNA